MCKGIHWKGLEKEKQLYNLILLSPLPCRRKKNPNEIKYCSMIYKVYTLLRNIIYIFKCYTGGQMWKKISEML